MARALEVVAVVSNPFPTRVERTAMLASGPARNAMIHTATDALIHHDGSVLWPTKTDCGRDARGWHYVTGVAIRPYTRCSRCDQ